MCSRWDVRGRVREYPRTERVSCTSNGQERKFRVLSKQIGALQKFTPQRSVVFPLIHLLNFAK